MGILNLTPDSFSDGGQFNGVDAAVEGGLELVDQGADLLDLGAESTRPAGKTYGQGGSEISAQEEIDRLLPVLEALRPQTSVPISIDTRKGEVARTVIAAGADIINDVTAISDPVLGQVVAEAQVPIVLMHLRGTLPEIQHLAQYDDVVLEVLGELREAVDRAEGYGIRQDRILLDPGIGFAKDDGHNLALLKGALRAQGAWLPTPSRSQPQEVYRRSYRRPPRRSSRRKPSHSRLGRLPSRSDRPRPRRPCNPSFP